MSTSPHPGTVPAAALAALSAVPEALVVTRDEWERGGAVIEFANPAFAALTGYAPVELVGRNTRELHGPRTDLTRAGSTPPFLAGEDWLHRRDGTPFFASWKFSPLSPGRLVGVYRDATEIRRLQSAVIHAHKLDTVGQLAGGAAHGLNNLLSIINGYSEILAGQLADRPAAQKELGEIHRAGLKAAGIARQILEFSRRPEFEVRVVNVNTLIREIGEILRRAVGEAVKLELRLASDLGHTRLDPTQFQHVLLNLCFNGRDAMPGGGKLTVRTFRCHDAATAEAAAGPCIAIEVSDSGAGMDAATQARVFEPFFTTKPHGTGLGLAIARSIIEEAGGSINVRSTANAGTTFRLLLPETAERETILQVAEPAATSVRSTEAVWVVEADEVVRKMIAGILAADGYRVHEHASAAAALAAVGGAAPDLILLDCGAANAPKLVGAITALNAQMKVLAISPGSPAAALPGVPARLLGHLPKPFALSTLLRTVRGLLDRPLR